MERVTGIGGVFFRAADPEGLGQWYAKHLGVEKTPGSYEEAPWWQQQGPTVFNAFSQKTTYFGAEKYQWMINFRVKNLDAMVKQLRDADIDVEVDAELYPNGRFARLQDPEGNPIQLWEPHGQPNTMPPKNK